MPTPSQIPDASGTDAAPGHAPSDRRDARESLRPARPESLTSKTLRADRGEVVARHGIARDRVRSALRRGA